MKASDLKAALDPHIKRASQKEVKNIINKIKKKGQTKNMPTTKKEPQVKYIKEKSFGALKDIVEMKKQKAVANELDSVIYEQGIEKRRRENVGTNKPEKERTPSIMETVLINNPDKIKDMSIEDAAKLSIFTNPSKSNDISMLTSLFKNNNNGGNNMTDKVLGIILDKLFANNGNNNNQNVNSNDKIMELMMQQNLQTQKMLMSIMENRNTAPVVKNNDSGLIKELFGVIKTQSELENSYLKDKLNRIESQPQGLDPLAETARVIDFMKTVKGAFGSGNQSEASLKHEVRMKELEYENNRQSNEEITRVKRMDGMQELINNSIKTVGKVLSEPIAEAAKAKVEQFTESIKHPNTRQNGKVSPEMLKNEIDLGDIENLEEEITDAENLGRQKTKNSRFKVYTHGK